MDTQVSHPDASTEFRRGGFWRRWLATLIDTIIVMVPFQILAAILFSLTAGMIQMDGGLFTVCAPIKTIPQSLDPPPPHDWNFAQVCKVSFFGAPTGAVLTVGRTTIKVATAKTVTQNYLLDANGVPIHGFAIDMIVWLSLAVYLAVMIWKTGRSLGDRILGLRVIDTADPAGQVPFRKAILRYPAMILGAVPVFALLAYRYVIAGGSSDAMFTDSVFREFVVTAVIAAVWGIVLTFQIARKRDPYYDRLAGTAVVRA